MSFLRGSYRVPLIAIALCLATACGVKADDQGSMVAGVTEESRLAVEQGLAWLASKQNKDGSWSCKIGYKLNDDYMGKDEHHHVGVTALAGMAFVAHGNTPGRGKYGAQVAGALDFILEVARQGMNGYITANGTRMYEHAFCTMFLAEIFGMSPRPDLADALRRSVGVIVRSQNDEGGWRYQPFPRDADLSLTVSTLQGLRAARNVGILVPDSVIRKAMAYVKRCAKNRDGSFAYQDLPAHQTRFTVPLTAAGVTSLYSGGEYDALEAKRGLEYLRVHFRELHFGEYHYFYGHYYAAQAMYQGGGRYWNDYFPKLREEILRHQKADGSWDDDVGPTYATAMAALILQLPNEYLPIFQR